MQFLTSITDLDADQWDSLWPKDHPFVRHAFLAALEQSGSIDRSELAHSGWQVQHLVAFEGQQLVAAMPLFIKSHSYGEYVFDWSWANAYQQAGMDYYPKLINAIPFTPASGPRIGFSPALEPAQQQPLSAALLAAIERHCEQKNYSGFHGLFPHSESRQHLLAQCPHERLGVQFHWFNQGFTSFAHFLDTFASRKRKNIKKERDKVAQHGFTIKMRSAAEVSKEEWDTFTLLYHRTYIKRSGRSGYLGKDFFHRIATTLPDKVLLASAHHHDSMIAAAVYFRDDTTLYGRYWGAQVDIDGLHFECCYYQGIEYAINHGLERFDPGAQGEHKIQRGFTPILTSSVHQLRHPSFNRAVGEFVAEEAAHVRLYLKECRASLPFKDGIIPVDENILLHPSFATYNAES